MRSNIGMKECRAAFLFAVVVLMNLTSGSKTSAADEPLRWKFKEGETITYLFKQKNDIKVKVPGQDMTNTTDLSIELTWKVKKVSPDGSAEISQLLNRVQAKFQLGPQTINYDSKEEKPSDDPAVKALDSVYRPALGVEYQLKVDARGKIIEAKVPEKVTKALLDSPFQVVADGGSVLSEKGLKNLFVQVIPTLPEKALAKGDTWKSNVELPVKPLNLAMASSNTLTASDSANATIEAQIDTSIKTDSDAPFSVEVKKQSGKGTYNFDTKAGRIKDAVIHQEIGLNLGYMNQVVEQSINIDAQLTLVK